MYTFVFNYHPVQNVETFLGIGTFRGTQEQTRSPVTSSVATSLQVQLGHRRPAAEL